MNEREYILDCLEKIAMNLDHIVSVLIPEQSVIYMDGNQRVNCISVEDAVEMIDRIGCNSASEMIGKTDYILIYDASKKLIVDGESYLPSGYLVMKSEYGLHGLDESDINQVLAELRSRTCTLALGEYRIQTYKLS